MTTFITTFDDLSSELILCIFEYLSVADRYTSFFTLNTRLHQLVKQWTSYSRKGLDADILRFSTLHSWYKLSLHDGGVRFFIYPRQNQQPYNDSYDALHSSELHWWFIWYKDNPTFTNTRLGEIVRHHSFRLTPFFYHREMYNHRNSDSNDKPRSREFYGGDLIIARRNTTILSDWLKSNYPEHADRILNANNDIHDLNEACAPIFEAEWIRLTQAIRDAAYGVWEELKQLEDINPLEIREK